MRLIVSELPHTVVTMLRALSRPRPDLRVVEHRGAALSLLREAVEGGADGLFLGPAEGCLDGLVVADELQRRTDPPLPVVLVGYPRDLAQRGFDLGAVDFLPVPVTQGRLERCVDRVARAVEGRRGAGAATGRTSPVPPDRTKPEPLWISAAGVRHAIDPADLLWASSSERGSMIRLAHGTLRHTEPLALFAQRLDPGSFLRIHVSHVVNRRAIASVRRLASGKVEVVTRTGEVLPVSRSCQPALRGIARPRGTGAP